jgi:bis(5'-nucleosyl)-tetraphosphatase (symmetrical)
MAIYAIGDIQGCYDELMHLLDHINFNEHNDQLWFTGDLVNRGPKSLETLRFVKSLGKSAITVLGNHDLHLLAVACRKRPLRKKDSLEQIIQAADCDELLHWLRHQPLFHYNDEFSLIHAGLPPQWDFKTTRKMANKVEKKLRGKDFQEFFTKMYGNTPDIWSDNLKDTDQLRFIVNCFTRMRYCDVNGKLDFVNNSAPGTQPKHLLPWFEIPKRKNAAMKIIFGHWSTLGYYAGENCYGIDSGCLWGGRLTALKLTGKIKRLCVDCPCAKKPDT